tara:strand:+ start:484 stop:1503 length:1020 start_codon:yes stop_codon:yes gene_type:complete
MKRYLFLISIVLLSCQEEITLDLPQAEEKLVVEGAIEPGFPPYVILTKNQGYFDPISDNPLLDIIVNDVDTVKVWYYNANGEKEIRILEQIPGLDSLPPIYTDLSYFSIANNYEFSQEGETYYLEIKWNNEIITSETTIPEPTPLDCLWVEESETAEKDFKCVIRAVYSDPGNIQNNVLIRSKRLQHWKRDSINGQIENKNDPQLILVDAGADILINGESFETYFPRPKEEGGVPSGLYNTFHYKTFDNNGTEDTVFLPHDIVLIKFCQIDEPSLKFWRGVVRQFTTNGNPFSEPMNLVSNINNGLGGWTGYGATYYKIPIIKDTVIKQEYEPEIIDIF